MAAGLTSPPAGGSSLDGPSAAGGSAAGGSAADRSLPGRLPAAVPAIAAAIVAVVLVARIGDAWYVAADTSPPATIAFLAATLVLFLGVVVAAVAGSPLMRWGADALLLLAGATVVVTEQRSPLTTSGRRYPSDEGRLVQHAIALVLHGHDPYSRSYPDVAHFAGNTPVYSGGAVHTFGYPPLAPELGALLGRLHRAWGDPGVVGLVGLLATAVVCLLVLPPVWRTIGIGVTLGLAPLTTYAINGHPVMLALPLLCLACAGWSRLGGDGRLGLVGGLQAVCLGLAAAAQQLAWFPALGLVLSLLLVARGRFGLRTAALLTARYAGVAVGAFVVVGLPFLAASPGSWLTGVLAPFTGPHTVATGQGLVAFALSVRHGGGAFQFFSYATILLLVGLLVVIALAFRRLAAIVPVLLTLIFLVSIRSQVEYFLVLAPLWVVWAAGTVPAVVDAVPPLLPVRVRRLVLGVVLVPALACTVVALVVPAPLRLTVALTSLRNGRVQQLRVVVDNRTTRRIHPHYYLDPPSHLRSPWRVVAGPRSLAAGQHATVTLRPALLGPERPTAGLRVWAIADDPQTMSSVSLPRR